MALLIHADFNDFENAFRRADRQNQFSRVGLYALFQYYDDLSDDTGENIELDVIGICCEFSEFVDIAELREAYKHLDRNDEDDEGFLQYLQDRTTVIPADDGYLVADF